ncbi:MAG: cyclase family protein [Clostridia bacterium]|nr:cyclase family protein [Clostridia bacterium]
MRIIDISRDIFTAEVYPGDPEPRLQRVERMEEGDDCNLAALYFCLHNGTHIDAPRHFIEDGMTAEELDLSRFIGECLVLEVPEGPINGDFIDENVPESCERLIVKSNGKAYFSQSGAFAAASTNLKLVGTDSNSVGIHGAQLAPHRAFLGANIPLLEGLDLEKVTPGKYFLVALPMKFSGVEATPTRAILISDFVFWGKA